MGESLRDQRCRPLCAREQEHLESKQENMESRRHQLRHQHAHGREVLGRPEPITIHAASLASAFIGKWRVTFSMATAFSSRLPTSRWASPIATLPPSSPSAGWTDYCPSRQQPAVEFNAKEHRHFDHGYAVTSHSSQGLTAERVLVNADTSVHPDLLNSRFGYVSISRASHDATSLHR